MTLTCAVTTSFTPECSLRGPSKYFYVKEFGIEYRYTRLTSRIERKEGLELM